MKIVAYYLAIVMLILFVGVVIYRLLFGSPCTIVGNYCVGDGWTMAGLAATILGVSATVLGILGAFALAAWWTGLDDRVRKQVDTSLKQQEEALNKRVDDILKQQGQNVTDRVNDLMQLQEKIINKQIQEDLTRFSERISQDFAESEQVVKVLDVEIKTLRSEYDSVNKMADNIRRLAVDLMMFPYPWNDYPWNIENQATATVFEYEIVDIAVVMLDKYLRYVEDFLSGTPSEKTRLISDLKKNGAPSTEFQWFWNSVLSWQSVVKSFSEEHPEIMKQVNDKVESYQKRIDEAEQDAAHEV